MGFEMVALACGLVLRVIDGDTLEARIALWPGLEVTTVVRLAGIDTPERRARCAEERAAAEAATVALRELVEAARGRVCLSDVEPGTYRGRVAARVWLPDDALEAAEALLVAGHGRRYDGTTRRRGWCPPGPTPATP